MTAITSVTEFDALTTPTPATSPSEIVTTNAPLYREGYNETTYHPYDFARNQSRLYYDHVLDVAKAKNSHWFCRYGILIGDATWVDFYLGVVAAVMDHRNQVTPDGRTWTTTPDVLPNGAFPGQLRARKKGVYSLHNKVIIMERFATCLAELKASAFYAGARATTIDTLITQVDEFANYLATFTDSNGTLHIDKFWDECGLGNQMMACVSFLQTMANLTGTAAYQTLAETMYGKLDDATGSTGKARFSFLVTDGDGTFLTEKFDKDDIGYDGSYNSLSLELMCNYYLALPSGAQKTAIFAVIESMRAKLKAGVDLVTFPGTVSTAGWTRVIEDPPRMPNSTVFNWCSLAFHDRFAAAITETDEDLSDTIMSIGQAFGHDGEETDPPDPGGGGEITGTGSLRLSLLTRDTRSFSVSPAVSGKTLWNLDTDGPCTFLPGVYSITPRSIFSASVALWGSAGGSGGVGTATVTNGSAGSATTFTTEGTTMSAGGGGGSNSKTSNSVGNPGAGGTATGGDVNTSGSTGTSGVTGSTSTSGSGGNAAAPGGGTGAAGASAGAGVTTAGAQGTAPGGGSSGAVHGNATGSARRAAGGSGGGARCQRTFAAGVLTVDATYTLVVATGGAKGTGDLADGAAGKDGSAVFT